MITNRLVVHFRTTAALLPSIVMWFSSYYCL
jgi:hypothetical protein